MFEDQPRIALGQPCGIHSQEDAPVPAGSAETKPAVACGRRYSPRGCGELGRNARALQGAVQKAAASAPAALRRRPDCPSALSIKSLYDMDEPTKPAGMLSINRLGWVLACSIMLYS